jgi:protein phosphatase
MTPEADFAGRQLRGARTTQDDYYGFCPLTVRLDGLDGLLLVLADGMGGYAGGAIASRTVVEAFVEHFCVAAGSIAQRLRGSLRASQRRLMEEITGGDASLRHMGTTLIAALWCSGTLHWVSVGDSGLYLYRDGELQRLNADHSMAPVLAEQAARGEITAHEAATHPERTALRSAITHRPLEIYELRDEPFHLQPGDLILAATDGLASLPPDEIAEQLEAHAHESAEQIVTALLEAVEDVQHHKQDNATVALVRQPDSAL